MDLQAHAGPEGSTRTTPRRKRTARRCWQRVRRVMRTNLDRGSWPGSPTEGGKNKTRWLVAYRVSLNSGGRASGWNGSREAVLRHTPRAANPPLHSGWSMRRERVAKSGAASWGPKANIVMGGKQRRTLRARSSWCGAPAPALQQRPPIKSLSAGPVARSVLGPTPAGAAVVSLCRPQVYDGDHPRGLTGGRCWPCPRSANSYCFGGKASQPS